MSAWLLKHICASKLLQYSSDSCSVNNKGTHHWSVVYMDSEFDALYSGELYCILYTKIVGYFLLLCAIPLLYMWQYVCHVSGLVALMIVRSAECNFHVLPLCWPDETQVTCTVVMYYTIVLLYSCIVFDPWPLRGLVLLNWFCRCKALFLTLFNVQ